MLRGEPSRRLLEHVVMEVGALKPEGCVAGELGCAGWDEVVSFGDVVDVVDGEATALEEERGEDDGVRGTEDGLRDIGFEGEVSAESAVAA